MNYGKNEVARKLQRSSSKPEVASKLVLWLVKLVLVLLLWNHTFCEPGLRYL